jgi:hypothetical protein
MWISVILGYLVIGFTVFKMLYAKWRGNLLAKARTARTELDLAREAVNNTSSTDLESHAAWAAASDRHRDASRRSSAYDRKVIENFHLTGSAFVGALWPIALVTLIAIGLGLLIKVTLFRGGLDRGAQRQADRIVARERAALEQKRREAELIALGRKILESPEEES